MDHGHTATKIVYGNKGIEDEQEIAVPITHFNTATIAKIAFEQIAVTSNKKEFKKLDDNIKMIKK